jgi:hypothetical protein
MADYVDHTMVTDVIQRFVAGWRRLANKQLGPFDEAFRKEGIQIIADITAPHVLRPGVNLKTGKINVPLLCFPVLFSTALYLAEASEAALEGRPWFGENATFFGQPAFDPVQHPLVGLTIDIGGKDPFGLKYGEVAVNMAHDAMNLLVLHEVSHCSLGHAAIPADERKSDATKARALEVEADTFSGLLLALIDPRGEDEKKAGRAVWVDADVARFGAAAYLLSVVLRARVPKPQSYHMATSRFNHIVSGFMMVFAKHPQAAAMRDVIFGQANMLAMAGAMGNSFSHYVEKEPECEKDWADYLASTAPIQQQLAARLSEHRVPLARTLLRSLGYDLL